MLASTIRFPGNRKHGATGCFNCTEFIICPALLQLTSPEPRRQTFQCPLHSNSSLCWCNNYDQWQHIFYAHVKQMCTVMNKKNNSHVKKSVIRTHQHDACELQGRKISCTTKAQRQPAIFIYRRRNDADEQGCLFKRACLSGGVSKQQG